MPTILACPEETDLLALAMGEPGLAEVAAHVDGCASCRTKLEQLQSEVAILRANQSEMSLSPSTCPSAASEATSDLEFACASVDNPDATASWEFDDMAGNRTGLPPTGTVDDGAGSTSDEPPLPPAIGKYLVVGRFPPTGQAEVYRVFHPQFQQERVLKLAKEPVGADGRSEIIEEGKILSELEHPHLVRVFDLDFLDDRPYLVMEYIRGRNLDQLASEGQITPRHAAELVAKVASAAALAHSRGVVHRDIKPKNILVDAAGEPRLIDFGMARLRTAWRVDGEESDGGTFAFMAPEQARINSPEDRQKVGPRSDVFALGAVLYFLLTGKAPFPGRNWRESMDRARRCDFDRETLNDRAIPRDLRRTCLKAMSADPAGRYPSAEALRKALLRFLAGPKIRAVAAGAAGLAVLGPLIVGAKLLLFDSSRVNGAEAIALQVTRGTSLYADYQKALPLKTGDRLKIRCAIPSGTRPVVFWVDSEGGVKQLVPVGFRRDDGGNQVVYPEQGVVPVEGPPGTELVVVCANRWGQARAVEAAAALSELGRLPDLPENVRFQISRQGTRILADRGLGTVESDQLEAIKGRIERLRIRLLNQFDLVEGLVVSHQDAH
jgi:predicted Ser/Thr protein kinase